jgi:excisionase family DNA binding protein
MSSTESRGIAENSERKTVTVDIAAKILGISRSFAYEAARRGEIPTIKIGRRLLVPRAALDRLFEQFSKPAC